MHCNGHMPEVERMHWTALLLVLLLRNRVGWCLSLRELVGGIHARTLLKIHLPEFAH